MPLFRVEFTVTKCEVGSRVIEAESAEEAQLYLDEHFAQLMDGVSDWREKSVADEYLSKITPA